MRKSSCISLTFALAALLLCFPCTAQKKYEREFGIKANAVPQKAIDFISGVFGNSKVHWYGEESLTGKSIEAKLKRSSRRYSIEFDEAGNIEDVEILIKVNQVNAAARKNLEGNLGKSFSRYRIIKTQLHWKGPEGLLKESLRLNRAVKGVLARYELVLKGSSGKTESYFEVLSEEDGSIVSIQQIVQRNTDNLIY